MDIARRGATSIYAKGKSAGYIYIYTACVFSENLRRFNYKPASEAFERNKFWLIYARGKSSSTVCVVQSQLQGTRPKDFSSSSFLCRNATLYFHCRGGFFFLFYNRQFQKDLIFRKRFLLILQDDGSDEDNIPRFNIKFDLASLESK